MQTRVDSKAVLCAPDRIVISFLRIFHPLVEILCFDSSLVSFHLAGSSIARPAFSKITLPLPIVQFSIFRLLPVSTSYTVGPVLDLSGPIFLFRRRLRSNPTTASNI